MSVSPGRGKILPSGHLVKVDPVDGTESAFTWRLLAPMKAGSTVRQVLMIGETKYTRFQDAMRQALIAFTRHRVDLLVLEQRQDFSLQPPCLPAAGDQDRT